MDKNKIGYSVEDLREESPLLSAFIYQAPSSHRVVKAFKNSENPPDDIIEKLRNMDDSFSTFLVDNDIHHAKRNPKTSEDEIILSDVIQAEDFGVDTTL